MRIGQVRQREFCHHLNPLPLPAWMCRGTIMIVIPSKSVECIGKLAAAKQGSNGMSGYPKSGWQ
jgi:hypothetical protein